MTRTAKIPPRFDLVSVRSKTELARQYEWQKDIFFSGSLEKTQSWVGEKPGSPLENLRAFLLDGRAVGGVTLHQSPIALRGRKLYYTGVGEVFILPQHRGQGYGRALLQAIRREIFDSKMDFSLLFTDRTTFYSPCGWTPYPTTRQFLPVRDISRLPEFTEHSSKQAPWEDFPSLRSIYEANLQLETGMEVREKSDWKRIFRRFRDFKPLLFKAFGRGGETAAYATALPDGPYLRVTEAHHLPGAEDSMKSLCASLLKAAQQMKTSYLYAELPETHPLAVRFFLWGGGRIRRFDRHAFVPRPVDLMRKILPELELRLQKTPAISFDAFFPFAEKTVRIRREGLKKNLRLSSIPPKPNQRGLDGPILALLLGYGPSGENPFFQMSNRNERNALIRLRPKNRGIPGFFDAF